MLLIPLSIKMKQIEILNFSYKNIKITSVNASNIFQISDFLYTLLFEGLSFYFLSIFIIQNNELTISINNLINALNHLIEDFTIEMIIRLEGNPTFFIYNSHFPKVLRTFSEKKKYILQNCLKDKIILRITIASLHSRCEKPQNKNIQNINNVPLFFAIRI